MSHRAGRRAPVAGHIRNMPTHSRLSFGRGTLARKARGKVAEDLKRLPRNKRPRNVQATSTQIVKQASPKARIRLARRGII